jgi:tetratricopeptide (TPR) repeat protein
MAIDWLAQRRQQYPELAAGLYLLESDMLVKNELYDNAHFLLTEALDKFPDNQNLLYGRSLVSEKRMDIELLEQDLREMLRHDPSNPLALNALGYSLANLTDRYDEALELIRKALSLKPDDAAIMDSMGWVLYRLGNYQESLDYLTKALSLFPNHEVAAHLGEVLWVTGQHEKALSVFTEALAKEPDSQILKSTMERLQIDPDQLETGQ